MTEGPTARYKAWLVYSKLGGKIVKRISAKSRRVNIDLQELLGKKFTGFDTYGKNILFIFERYGIRLHLMMYGTIHIYGEGEELRKDPKLIKLDITLDTHRLVVYNAPIVEIDYAYTLTRRLKKMVGEDPLRDDWDPERAMKLILRNQDKKIGEVLLDQRVIAGVGNILRNEILFRARIHPDRLVRELNKEDVKRIVDISEKLLREWFELKKRGEKISQTILIYGKSGKPCPVCGTPIRFYRQKPHNRRTYFCPKCQK